MLGNTASYVSIPWNRHLNVLITVRLTRFGGKAPSPWMGNSTYPNITTSHQYLTMLACYANDPHRGRLTVRKGRILSADLTTKTRSPTTQSEKLCSKRSQLYTSTIEKYSLYKDVCSQCEQSGRCDSVLVAHSLVPCFFQHLDKQHVRRQTEIVD